MATTVVQVMVLDAGGDGPQRDPAATLSLEVGEKSSTVIRRSHLAYTVSRKKRLFNRLLSSTHTRALSSAPFCLPGRCIPGRADPNPAGVSADVRNPDQEPVAAGAPGAEGVLVLHHGGRQRTENQVGSSGTAHCWDAPLSSLSPLLFLLSCSDSSSVLFIKQVTGESALM